MASTACGMGADAKKQDVAGYGFCGQINCLHEKSSKMRNSGDGLMDGLSLIGLNGYEVYRNGVM